MVYKILNCDISWLDNFWTFLKLGNYNTQFKEITWGSVGRWNSYGIFQTKIIVAYLLVNVSFQLREKFVIKSLVRDIWELNFCVSMYKIGYQTKYN